MIVTLGSTKVLGSSAKARVGSAALRAHSTRLVEKVAASGYRWIACSAQNSSSGVVITMPLPRQRTTTSSHRRSRAS